VIFLRYPRIRDSLAAVRHPQLLREIEKLRQVL